MATQDLRETCWQSYRFLFFTLLNSVFSPVRNFHLSWVYSNIYWLLISVSMKIFLDFFCASSKCWDLKLKNKYLDLLKVLANASRFFYFLSLMVSIFLHFYCRIFYSFSIIYFYLSCLLLWALIESLLIWIFFDV